MTVSTQYREKTQPELENHCGSGFGLYTSPFSLWQGAATSETLRYHIALYSLVCGWEEH